MTIKEKHNNRKRTRGQVVKMDFERKLTGTRLDIGHFYYLNKSVTCSLLLDAIRGDK
jgi:hypothetical protein